MTARWSQDDMIPLLHRRAARAALSALTLLTLGGCAAHAPSHAPAGPSVAGVPTKARLVPVRLTTDVTRIASLVHFVDSLADTSGGKSVPTYRALWSARIGAPTEEDREALEAYRAARHSATAEARCARPAPGSVNAHPGWRTRFLYTAIESRDLESFLADIEPCLTAEESRGLERALAHFTPGFEVFWGESGGLHAFDRDFQDFLASGRLPLYLGEVARWFGVDPSASPPSVLAFVMLPAPGGTHAQALGRRLLVEVRPLDTPIDQIAVVAHEESHYLFYQIPPDRLGALEARALAAGPDGAQVWLMLQEAIPTALGQGLAVARLQPDAFRPNAAWYHVPEVDTLAHLVYPLVRDALDSGRAIDGDFIEACVRAWEARAVHGSATPPLPGPGTP